MHWRAREDCTLDGELPSWLDVGGGAGGPGQGSAPGNEALCLAAALARGLQTSPHHLECSSWECPPPVQGLASDFAPLGPSCSSVGDKAQRQHIGTRRLLVAESWYVPSLIGQNWLQARWHVGWGAVRRGDQWGVVSDPLNWRGLAPGNRQNPPRVTGGGGASPGVFKKAGGQRQCCHGVRSYGLPLQALPHRAQVPGAGPGCVGADWMPVQLNTNQYCSCVDERWPSALPPPACTLVR